MKTLLKILFSPRTTIGLLVIFAIAMGAATFIENSYDTVTAKILIYHAKWFELIMILLIINFIGSIQRYHLLSWKKIPGFIFHIAFAIIILGAGVTRYIGYEGQMHIREGSMSNFISTNDNYLIAKFNDGDKEALFEKKLLMGMNIDNSFTSRLNTSKGDVAISYNNFIRNAKETIVEMEEGDINLLYLTLSVQGHKDEIIIKKGELKMNHDFPIAYENQSNPNALMISELGDSLVVSYHNPVIVKSMVDFKETTLTNGTVGRFSEKQLYEPVGSDVTLVMTKRVKNGSIQYTSGSADQNTPNILVLDVSHNGATQQLMLKEGMGIIQNFQKVSFGDLDLELSYGPKRINLPFSIKLNDFILDRYGGSRSPSSFASDVMIIDPRENKEFVQRISMNNVLDYDGYRFFQSSYDRDEKGSILSVNHDWWGTMISYFGYTLMIIGFIWTLLNPHSRYWDLMKKIRNLRERRKLLTLLLIAFSISLTSAQSKSQSEMLPKKVNVVSQEHANNFGRLMVLTYEGRYAPINTLAIDVLHKISRKDKILIPSIGELTANQIFLDIPLHAEFWKNQEIIYIREEGVSDLLGIKDKYASFNTFFDDKGTYRLKEYAEKAFRKPDGERNKLDREIIKVNERLEIFMMTFKGSLLDIFPLQKTPEKWVSWDDPSAKIELQGSIRIINDDLRLPRINYNNLMRSYLQETYKAVQTGNYSASEKVLGYISSIQRHFGKDIVLPSEKKLQHEINYNNSNIFIKLRNFYSILSVILLFLAFIDNLRSKRNKIISYTLNISIALLFAGFIYHSYGLIMRWYLSGHAPWSNGYEALLLVSWASLLAGFSFSKYSKITLAATALLAFLTLMTASHSSYDPQLTNLQPVLKSYWLIIHVATLTISYGFLGLGLVLGLFNMFIYIFKNSKNYKRLSLITRELTYINEMTLTIGLLLATVGTFLGGVWANESWGRYWGWDAKETWALVITVVYTIILHLRLAPKIKGEFIFNTASIFGFGSVLMTFIGVNYYFTKGLHSYASGETPVFPIWIWLVIALLLMLIFTAGYNKRRMDNQFELEDR
ncbi:cytochrome c biogenesis protein [Aestuariivivens sediminicola]|uniref:cytochrome c biogenesis protein n=1 Tax=Aestuariivivens sediminicola TaxID=2913560 RepID=UPI001F59C876|nr:cytochrome c biogenesis protein CcsA [Aestuariivivens sediminicola]